MNKTILIACDDQGQYSVGEQPTAEAAVAVEGADAEGHPPEATMAPARDLNDALAQAKQLFEQPQTTDGGPSPFQQGFAKVAKNDGGMNGMGGADMAGM